MPTFFECLRVPSSRRAATAIPLLLSASLPAAADTVQISLTTDVTQNVQTQIGHPGFYHQNQGMGDPYSEGYIFFDEHVRVLTEEAGVWDESQIPTSGADTPFGDDYDITTTGTLTGTWTFDASLLQGIDTSVATSSLDTAQFLGTTSDVSLFKVVSGGVEVVNAITVSSSVYAANDIVLGEGGETFDLIGVAADNPAEPGIESSGVVLFMAGAATWFDAFLDGGTPDYEAFFSGVQMSAVEYQEHAFYTEETRLPTGVVYGPDHPMYEVTIESGITQQKLNVVGFGAADGSSEDAPLLPDTAILEEGAQAPTFAFDVSTAGPGDIVFIDPEIAVGYTYELVGEGAITAFVAPTAEKVGVPADFQGYQVVVKGGALDGQIFTVMPGEEQLFAADDDVRELVLTGIWQDLALDPTDFQTFVAGFGLMGATDGTRITQTAIVVDTDAISPVPLPAGALLMLTALGGLAGLRRRKAA